ncbi:ferredoxin--NADP reductase [Saprospiraceae bacterium]|nr:ferredoxin--NADP reductase [Saprospiraceae bacterium]
MASSFHDIKLKAVIDETAKAKSLVFDIPESLQDNYSYKAGQYLTLKFEIDGEEFRRSYSLSSAPSENQWRVCVKRVEGGKISNYVCDKLKAGDTISLMEPDGRFTFTSDPENEGQYYLFAAGSGITPILAIAKEILETEPLSSVFLLYGNTSENEVIYKNEIENMITKYDGQFFMKHAYSDMVQKKSLLGSIFKKTSIDLPYFPGQIAKDTIKKFFSAFPMRNPQKASAYICGPGSMNENTKDLLVRNSMLKKQVFFESFGTADSGAKAGQEAGAESDVIVELLGEEIPLKIDASVTVLDALLDAGYDPPHSCSSGACSSCISKLVEGKVTMDVTHALDEDDIEDGYILTCQARVATANVRIKYE